MKAGMIGLGAMGTGMARNIAKMGYLAAIYNRTMEKAQMLAKELNVAVFDRIEALAAEMDVVLLCVSADSDVLAVVEAITQTIKPGSIVVDMSTVSSDAGFYNDPASRISRIGLPQCKRHLRVVGDLTRFQA